MGARHLVIEELHQCEQTLYPAFDGLRQLHGLLVRKVMARLGPGALGSRVDLYLSHESGDIRARASDILRPKADVQVMAKVPEHVRLVLGGLVLVADDLEALLHRLYGVTTKPDEWEHDPQANHVRSVGERIGVPAVERLPEQARQTLDATLQRVGDRPVEQRGSDRSFDDRAEPLVARPHLFVAPS